MPKPTAPLADPGDLELAHSGYRSALRRFVSSDNARKLPSYLIARAALCGHAPNLVRQHVDLLRFAHDLQRTIDAGDAARDELCLLRARFPGVFTPTLEMEQ
jgi:hypothetical protein